MFAQVIPLIKLPRRFQYLDYIVPKDMQGKINEGHLVAIYLRNKKIWGVVKKLSETTSAKNLKELAALIDIILPESTRAVLDWASSYYLASPAVFYKLMIPEPGKRIPFKGHSPPEQILYLGQKEGENVLAALRKMQDGKNFFLYDNATNETLAFFIKAAQKMLAAKRQILFLAPAADDLLSIAPYLFKIFGSRVILWSANLSAGKKYDDWKKISSGESTVILGTRPACFLPWKSLSMIFIYNYNSPDHKQWDQNPRYDARLVAEKIGNLTDAVLVRTDFIPDAETQNAITNGNIQTLNALSPRPEISLVDLKNEKMQGPSFSYPLYETIQEALEIKEKVILFLNRQDKDSYLYCQDCHFLFSCPACGAPLSFDNGKNLCYHCKIEKPAETTCPKCSGSRLKIFIWGVNTVKKFIGSQFPKARIQLAAKDKDLAGNDFDILLTTDFFWKSILPKLEKIKFYGAAIMDFDFYLARPEFNQKEVALSAFHRFINFARNTGAKKTIIQTYRPEHTIFGEVGTFYDKELDERKESGYPPFSRIIKIICKDKDKSKLEEDSKILYKKLSDSGFHPMPPYEPKIKKRTKNFLAHIILKESLDKSYSQLNEIIPDEYQIDVDPINIY